MGAVLFEIINQCLSVRRGYGFDHVIKAILVSEEKKRFLHKAGISNLKNPQTAIVK